MKPQKNLLALILVLSLLFIIPNRALSQDEKEKKEGKKDAYEFTIDKELARTPVKNQASSSTCWCFATLSFLESELLRMGKEEIDLSEMFIVRNVYPKKAQSYIRYHGKISFPHGGQCHDVLDMIEEYGIVPEETYPGNLYGEKKHQHGELTSILTNMLNAVLKKRGPRLTPKWGQAFEAVLDIYLGKPTETFTYKGEKYSTKTFLTDYLELNPDDYIEVTSYTHHPFYQQFTLELPDNWSFNDQFYNVPLDELGRIIDHSIENGYSVVYGGDVSSKSFFKKKGYAIVPVKDWEDKTEKEKKEKIKEPVEEKEITQQMRQKAFDNYTTTDDHAMHIVGIAHDQKEHQFYLIKNSWGSDRKYDGYVYLSKPFVLLNITTIMVNKNALPDDIKAKLGL